MNPEFQEGLNRARKLITMIIEEGFNVQIHSEEGEEHDPTDDVNEAMIWVENLDYSEIFVFSDDCIAVIPLIPENGSDVVVDLSSTFAHKALFSRLIDDVSA